MGLRDLLRRDSPQVGEIEPKFGQSEPEERHVRVLELSFGSLEAPDTLIDQMTGEGIAPRISRREALQVAAVIRARNLICGTLSTLDLVAKDQRHKRVEWPFFDPHNGFDPEKGGPAMLAQTYEDLLFESVAWWRVISRDGSNMPRHTRRIPPRSVSPRARDWLRSENTISEDIPFALDADIYVDGAFVPSRDIIRFDSPNLPLLIHGAGSIRTLLKLDQTTRQYADSPMPLGAFTPKDDADPPEDEEVEKALTKWEQARKRRVWGYIGAALELEQLQWNPEELQLVEARQNAVLDIARLAGIDPEDLSVSVTSRTYQNSEQRRDDLIDFTLSPYGSAVHGRLSRDDVTPSGITASIDYAKFARADTKTRMETYQLGKNVGAFTTAEIREAEEKPPLENGEEDDGNGDQTDDD